MNKKNDTKASIVRKPLFLILASLVIVAAIVLGWFDISIRNSTDKLSAESDRINQSLVNSFQAKQLDQDKHSRGGLFEKIYDCSIYSSTECSPYVTTNFTISIEPGSESEIDDTISEKVGYSGLNPIACTDGSRECSFVLYKNDFRLAIYVQPGSSIDQANVRLKLTYKD